MTWMLNLWLSPEDDAFEDSEIYPRATHFFYPVVFSVFVTVLRVLIERYFFMPLGMRHGLKSVKPVVKKNDALEKAFLAGGRNGCSSNVWIQNVAKQVDLTEKQVESWMRRRTEQDQPTELIFFAECGWRFTYHSILFLFGLYVLWDKPWLWNISECWTNFPNQTISIEVWWYYMLHLSLYISHTYSQLVQWKRNDFVEMFIHHIVTILLMALSWTSNSVRIGTLVLVVHDCADIFMEGARIAKFLNSPIIRNIFSVLFFISWTATRLGIFPFHILRNVWFDSISPIGNLDPVLSLLVFLLHILLCLHIFWTYFIIQIVYKFIVLGEIVGDSRGGDPLTEEKNGFVLEESYSKKS